MSDVLSQDEINALLASNGADTPKEGQTDNSLELSEKEKEKLAEVAQMSFGATSSVIQMMVNKDVELQLKESATVTPEMLSEKIGQEKAIIAQIGYKEGLKGKSYLLLKETSALVISDLMMGGTGDAKELGEMQLSAIGEMVNQMMGRTTTSLSEIFKQKIDITTPLVELKELKDETSKNEDFGETAAFFCIEFEANIAEKGLHYLYQLLPIPFAKQMTTRLLAPEEKTKKAPPPPPPNSAFGLPDEMPIPNTGQLPGQQPGPAMPIPGYGGPYQNTPNQAGGMPVMNNHNNSGYPNHPPMPGAPAPGFPGVQMPQISPVEFGMLQMPGGLGLQSNIDLLLDVPLQITVELGRTKMLIKDVLELGIGSVVELNKLAGESVEVFVNNKLIARGEVVVIDENFAVRITSIINPQDRLQAL